MKSLICMVLLVMGNAFSQSAPKNHENLGASSWSGFELKGKVKSIRECKGKSCQLIKFNQYGIDLRSLEERKLKQQGTDFLIFERPIREDGQNYILIEKFEKMNLVRTEKHDQKTNLISIGEMKYNDYGKLKEYVTYEVSNGRNTISSITEFEYKNDELIQAQFKMFSPNYLVKTTYKDGFTFEIITNQGAKIKYNYQLDLKGNWIVRSSNLGTKTTREIVYY
ncbi:hypothetical protein [Deinococcus misasensis]|uniref:hypothetical protein n=1 Tax=Deinococcus misasensis TaxID=392413 RepID=UPI0012F7FF34|nr:hypothetical protein [Deinococcus misasensis]